MNVQIETKTVVTVSEMARMCGLSRSRFYQLSGSAFPAPLMDKKKRPFYSEELQAVCLEVRRRNCGIDGKPILFYCRRSPVAMSARKKTPTPKTNGHAELVDGVKALGLAATPLQIDASLKTLFPGGTHGHEQGEVVRRVFIQLKTKGG